VHFGKRRALAVRVTTVVSFNALELTRSETFLLVGVEALCEDYGLLNCNAMQ
jgi:hypothetical protein